MPDERTPAAPETMHEAAWRWLLTCPYIEELFLGFATAREGGTVLVPLTACMDSAEREFVDGSSIRNYDFNPFDGILHSQDGLVSKDANHHLTSKEIISIDWLADNIIGRIPTAD